MQNGQNEANRRRDILRTLITVEALVVTALLVWAQLWGHTYDIYHGQGDPVWGVSLAKAGIYTAVLASLASLASAFYSLLTGAVHRAFERAFEHSIVLAGFSATITVLVVLGSALTTWFKALFGWEQWHPLWPADTDQALLFTLLATGVGVILLCLWYRCWGPRLAQRLSKREDGENG